MSGVGFSFSGICDEFTAQFIKPVNTSHVICDGLSSPFHFPVRATRSVFSLMVGNCSKRKPRRPFGHIGPVLKYTEIVEINYNIINHIIIYKIYVTLYLKNKMVCVHSFCAKLFECDKITGGISAILIILRQLLIINCR